MSRGLAALSTALLAAVIGCASTRPMHSPRPFTVAPHERIGMLPFEDLSGRVEVAQGFTRVFLATLVQTGTMDVIEPGVVEAAVESLRIRSTAAMTSAEIHDLANTIGATYILFGTVLEAGVVHTDEGDLPSVAAALRLVDARTQQVVWACHHARTGEDNATVFGWGRERSQDRLLGVLAGEMMQELRKSAVAQKPSSSERSER